MTNQHQTIPGQVQKPAVNETAHTVGMSLEQMKESYRNLEGSNVGRMEGDVLNGHITVTYMNGYKHTFKTFEDVVTAQKTLCPSGQNTPILGGLLFAILGV
ncbi:MAG: hypothetical protein V4563_14280 [Pseudomonadota bacterium]